MMTHLFATYGKLSPQQVKTKDAELTNMTFDLSQPIDIVFNAIEDLSALAIHAHSPMTAQQMIDLALSFLLINLSSNQIFVPGNTLIQPPRLGTT